MKDSERAQVDRAICGAVDYALNIIDEEMRRSGGRVDMETKATHDIARKVLEAVKRNPGTVRKLLPSLLTSLKLRTS